MRLFARAVIAAALASLVLAGVAIAAARDTKAKAGMYDGSPPGQVRIVSVLESSYKSRNAADILVLPPLDRMLVAASIRSFATNDGLMPPGLFFASAAANMSGSSIDVIVG